MGGETISYNPGELLNLDDIENNLFEDDIVWLYKTKFFLVENIILTISTWNRLLRKRVNLIRRIRNIDKKDKEY